MPPFITVCIHKNRHKVMSLCATFSILLVYKIYAFLASFVPSNAAKRSSNDELTSIVEA